MPRFIVTRCWAYAAWRSGRRSEARDQRRLARPEARAACPFDRDQHERVPGAPHEREEPEADSLQDQTRAEHPAGTQSVDERSRDQPCRQLCCRRHRDDEARDAEPKAAHVVQVDDEERQDEPVAERVHDAAELQQPHLAWELRVE
jgi:hypothetical protein